MSRITAIHNFSQQKQFFTTATQVYIAATHSFAQAQYMNYGKTNTGEATKAQIKSYAQS